MKVSIIIPYVEDRGFLRDAIRSCYNQDMMRLGIDYEVIRIKGERTLGANINKGVARAKGKYIKICPDDDMLTRNCLHDLYITAERDGNDFTCADAIDIGDSDNLVKSIIPKTVYEHASHNTIHGGTVLYLASSMPKWDEELWCAEEYDISLRMAASGCKFGYVNAVVFKYRRHNGQKSSNYWIERNGELRFDVIDRLQMRYYGNHTRIKT